MSPDESPSPVSNHQSSFIRFPVGKLPCDVLDRLIRRWPVTDGRVISPSGIGEDAAAIDFGDRFLVAKTDPITFATDEIGWYAVNVNANDIACRGAVPKWFLWTLLMPEEIATEDAIEEIFEQVHEASHSLGVQVVGGHTEISYGIDRPIIVGQMLGEAGKDELVMSHGARIGDAVLLTKGIPIEGVSILAREKERELLGAGVDAEVIHRAKDFLRDPGISVVREARIACDTARVHAMHDPTEGGVATGLYELAVAANAGLRIYEEEIPILPVALQFADVFSIDPLGLIASGSLLICVSTEDSESVIDAIRQQAIACRKIAEIVPPDQGVKLVGKHGLRDLPRFTRDEIAKLF